jgi:hypothetical protein
LSFGFDYRVLNGSKNEQGRAFEALYLMVQEQHLALKMSSSELLMSKRRERTPTKQQGKV